MMSTTTAADAPSTRLTRTTSRAASRGWRSRLEGLGRRGRQSFYRRQKCLVDEGYCHKGGTKGRPLHTVSVRKITTV